MRLGLALLLGLVAVFCVAHLSLAKYSTTRRLFGDEPVYAAQATVHAHEGLSTLVPGNLEFSKRPPFWGHVLSRLRPAVPAWAFGKPLQGKVKRLVRHGYLEPAIRLHVVLGAITLLAVYLQGLLLGLGPLGGWVPVLLLAALPRAAFHIHSLWSETLHMTLQTLALTGVLLCVRRPRYWAAIGAGVCLGFALLTRTTAMGLVVWVPACLVLVALWRRHWRPSDSAASISWSRYGLAAVAFVAATGAVVVPQYAANAKAGREFRIAANSWLNIRIGLLPGKHEPKEITEAWNAAAAAPRQQKGKRHENKYIRREHDAKAHVLAFIQKAPTGTLLSRQARRGFGQLVGGHSQFGFSLVDNKWSEPYRRQLQPLLSFDRVVWRWLVYLGLAGLLLLSFGNAGYFLLAGYAVYYVVALMAVPIGARMGLQLAPILCLGAGGLVCHAGRLAREGLRRLVSSARVSSAVRRAAGR